jgi:RNA polymerase sigma factor (sigma-70 family)
LLSVASSWINQPFKTPGRMSRISPELVAQLFDRHAAALELYAAQWVSAPADVVQEAFLQLVRQKRLPDRPVAWLYRVVRNGAFSAARREARRQHNEQAAIAQARLRFEIEGESPLDVGSAAKALQALPDEKREVVVARIWGGLTFEEIAEIAEISSSEAHRRYEAALAALRQSLGVTWLTKTISREK